MNVYEGAAPTELIEYRLVFGIAQPIVPVARLEAETVRLQRFKSIFNFLERPVDVDHREHGEQTKPAGLLAHPFGGHFQLNQSWPGLSGERESTMSLCRRLGTRLLSPDFEGRGTRHSVVGRRHPVTSWVKVSIDKPVRRQEALRLL
jgi:hypothetical protein